VLVGTPSTPADESDVALQMVISDVRNRTGLTDYTGELQLRTTLRVTDRASGATGSDPATTESLVLPVPATCAATATTSVGSTCSVATTFDAITPGAVDEGARAIWSMGGIEVHDGGPDGDVDTTGNGVFAKQGLFIP
jgi:hypothetical protein